MDSRRRDDALEYYSTALSIHPANTQRFFILRSKVCTAKDLWEDALNDADEVSSVVLCKSLDIEAE